MFAARFTLFKAFGIPVKLDVTLLFMAVLVAWSMVNYVFPELYDLGYLSTPTLWGLGLLTAVGLFASILLHEFGHALVAQHYGVRIRGITLFMFGGVAEMADEPPSARAEFWIAIAGPAVSVAIAALTGAVAWWLPMAAPLFAVISYLAIVNIVLVLFNMVPAFPLDGGRVLRAILWGGRGDLLWATTIAATVGSGFGLLFMALGGIRAFYGDFGGGFWMFLIGYFIYENARASLAHQRMRSQARELERQVHNQRPFTPTATLTKSGRLVPVRVDSRRDAELLDQILRDHTARRQGPEKPWY